MPQSLTPYIGSEPFIFISYSHRDEQRVIPVVHRLIAAGFRVWYDDAIEQGREWDNDIARHVRDCAVFIPFFTENYLASFNCKNELRYALSKNRRCLAVYLEHVSFENDPGIEMYVNVNQNIMAQTMTQDAVFDCIASAPLMQPCMAPPEPAEKQPAPENKHAEKIIAPAPVTAEPPQNAQQTEAPGLGAVRIIVWVLALLFSAVIDWLGFETLPMTASLSTALVVMLMDLIVGAAGAAAIAMTEARHPVQRRKNNFGLLFRGCVAGFNIVLPALMLAHGESVFWQTIVGAALAAAMWKMGKFCTELRQFHCQTTVRILFSLIWLLAVVFARKFFPDGYLVAGALQLAALTAFAVMTGTGAVIAYRNQESTKFRCAVRLAVCSFVIFMGVSLTVLSIVTLASA